MVGATNSTASLDSSFPLSEAGLVPGREDFEKLRPRERLFADRQALLANAVLCVPTRAGHDRMQPLSRLSSISTCTIISRNRDEYIPTPDGVKLAAHIISPIGMLVPRAPARAPHPDTVLPEIPFFITLFFHTIPLRVLRMHVIVCDSRGRFSSDGEFSFLANEKRDAKATLDWLSEQKW
eukprot:1393806-Amorphochlora_amoeboformis.AAC.1